MRLYTKYLMAFVSVFFIALSAFSDGSRALRLLEKKEYEKLIDHLNNSLEKDSLNPGAKYVYSLLYLDSAFSRFNIDTAYQYINAALDELPLLEEKEVTRLAKDNITDSLMNVQKLKVEETGFRRAKQVHSLAGYNYYIDSFAGANKVDSAIYHRNAIAYQHAVDENTYEAFQHFIYTYPDAVQIEDAKANYEQLLFLSQTEDGRLETFIRFLKNNPNTPHRKEAEKNIFEIITVDNEVANYIWFLENYPGSVWRKKAFDFLYHRYKEISGVEGFLNRFANFLVGDSLKAIAQAELKVILPVYDDGKYGFVDGEGNFMIPLRYDSINEKLLCGNITQDFLEIITEDGNMVVSRLGHPIYHGKYESIEDIGCGLLRVEIDGKFGIVHKSGEILLDFDFDGVELLNNTYLKAKLGSKWGLISLQGRKLLEAEYDEIESENNFILIKKGDYYAVQNVYSLNKAAQGEPIELFFSFDDYLLADDNHLITFAGGSETLVDNNLKAVSATEDQEIYRYFGGWIAKTGEGYRVYDLIFHSLSPVAFADVQKSKTKLAIKNQDKWGIYFQGGDFPEKFEYESVVFLGESISIINRREESFASFSEDTLVDISGNLELKLLKPQIANPEGREVPEYLLVKNKKGVHSVYNSQGVEVLHGRFDEIEAVGFEYLLVSKNGRKGLYHHSGKELLKTSYQGIGNYDNGYVSTLLNNKFGIYNYNKNELLLSAKHDKMLKIYSSKYFISEKGGKHAFVNLDNDIVSDYEFEKINNWNDTVALVRTKEFWALYDIKNKAYTFDKIELIELLGKDRKEPAGNTEQFLFVTRDNQKGVFSNISGEIIGATFNDVYNIGTLENPVFFAEKYIPEAEFYIIIYYNRQGEIIKKQVFTGEEYWKVYCSY